MCAYACALLFFFDFLIVCFLFVSCLLLRGAWNYVDGGPGRVVSGGNHDQIILYKNPWEVDPMNNIRTFSNPQQATFLAKAIKPSCSGSIGCETAVILPSSDSHHQGALIHSKRVALAAWERGEVFFFFVLIHISNVQKRFLYKR